MLAYSLFFSFPFIKFSFFSIFPPVLSLLCFLSSPSLCIGLLSSLSESYLWFLFYGLICLTSLFSDHFIQISSFSHLCIALSHTSLSIFVCCCAGQTVALLTESFSNRLLLLRLTMTTKPSFSFFPAASKFFVISNLGAHSCISCIQILFHISVNEQRSSDKEHCLGLDLNPHLLP